MIPDIKVDEEDPIDELEGRTGFNTQHEVETLKAMLAIAEDIYKSGCLPGLAETRKAVKNSVTELCEFFKDFVSYL